jgi:hypothetical protein
VVREGIEELKFRVMAKFQDTFAHNPTFLK